MKIRIHRKALLLGSAFAIAAILSGILVIEYTEAFFLVVILWIVAPIFIVQIFRSVRRRFLGR